MRRRLSRVALAMALIFPCGVPLLAQARPAQPALPTRVTVELAGGPVNVFRPDETFGAALDGHDQGWTLSTLTPSIVAAMKTVQAPALTYRLRTELGIEAWHWSPRGRWSDAAHGRGYWVSDDSAAAPIQVSYGYSLPRRGTTIDQGNNDGYSRLDDGDERTFWKSNPYLDPRYTAGDSALGTRHEQWLLVDFGRPVRVDAIRIAWAEPYATSFDVQYWDGAEQPRDPEALPPGGWRAFPAGEVRAGRGGSQLLRLGEGPVRTRWLRLYLRQSSHTALPGSSDPRDSLGYAIRELYAGVWQGTSLRDEIRHGRARLKQTVTWVSSTDPWHRPQDLDLDTEQPGLDLVVQRGLANGLAMLVPVPVFYDVPENAVAELRYLERRGIALRGVELGEEADGQRIRPEDYAALYLRLARMLRQVDATVPLGGPSLQTLYYGEMAAWHDAPDTLGWMGRFVRYLERRQALDSWRFFSWEFYPFIDVCHAAAPLLLRTRAYMRGDLERLRRDGVPASVPMYMTEYGFSAYSGPPEVELSGALMNDDAVAYFLTLGGRSAYVYGYEPAALERAPDCDRWGNNMLFGVAKKGGIAYRTATFHALRLLTTEWTEPG
ncbi:MAG TPA: discoidin domain-containing protein, partial [Longimicrobiales bacterium]